MDSVLAQALRQLDFEGCSQSAIDVWVEEARIDAIIGSCALSLKSVKSGTRCYMAFVGAQASSRTPVPVCCRFSAVVDATGRKGKGYFPPALESLMAWTTLFRSPGTLGNYLGYVKTACLLVCAPTEVLSLNNVWLYLPLFACCCRRCLTAQTWSGPSYRHISG